MNARSGGAVDGVEELLRLATSVAPVVDVVSGTLATGPAVVGGAVVDVVVVEVDAGVGP